MPPDEAPGVGELLRRHRVAARLTQEELAERAGLSVRGLSDLERGTHRAPHRDTLQRLAAALGLETSERATLLAAARQHLPGQPAAVFSPTRELPVVLSSFVGREHDVAEVGRLLHTARLLTLTGAGGVGKTRLAIEVTRALADEVVFVDLVPLAHATLVPQTVAGVLGIREQPQRLLLKTLARALRTRRMVLILDN
ncbi:MAG TPA: helix-turn-helix domain-containing protein, partial [Chloroflexota bacterium]|nr:helix-turn-helix domain-containing protein [Chloroflexota bacterium]